jgi:phosphatidylserine/phosphatidylglycerophosphate/cardiolipin synthase-like enzyme
VGSSNWNHRSTLHDLELDVVIRDAAQVKELESLVETDCNDSIELRAENLPPRSLGARLWYLLRYWM